MPDDEVRAVISAWMKQHGVIERPQGGMVRGRSDLGYAGVNYDLTVEDFMDLAQFVLSRCSARAEA
jgi:hypothetical protein